MYRSFCQMLKHWTRENAMSNGCQALNPLSKESEGAIGQFGIDSRGSQTVPFGTVDESLFL